MEAAQIGSGSFAVVWKATRRVDGSTVAIKEINTEKLNGKLRESLESEIAILQVGLSRVCVYRNTKQLFSACSSHWDRDFLHFERLEPSSDACVCVVWCFLHLQRTHHPNIIHLHDLRRVRPVHMRTHSHIPPPSSTHAVATTPRRRRFTDSISRTG